MADLKAAVKRLRGGDWITPSQDKADRFLAAQALEALAWQAETGASLRKTTGGEFWCAVKVNGQQLTNNYYADTPLGAILAAMEASKS